jgi:hypothetical protein
VFEEYDVVRRHFDELGLNYNKLSNESIRESMMSKPEEQPTLFRRKVDLLLERGGECTRSAFPNNIKMVILYGKPLAEIG